LAHSPNVEGFALSAIRCKVVLANLTLGLAYATFPADFGVVKLSFKAILLGFLASVVADFAFGVVLGSVFYLVKHINFQQLNSNPSFKFVTALIGTLVGILAGYVTGRIAKQYPIYIFPGCLGRSSRFYLLVSRHPVLVQCRRNYQCVCCALYWRGAGVKAQASGI